MAARTLAALRQGVRPMAHASFRLERLSIYRAYTSAATQDPMTGELMSVPGIEVSDNNNDRDASWSLIEREDLTPDRP